MNSPNQPLEAFEASVADIVAAAGMTIKNHGLEYPDEPIDISFIVGDIHSAATKYGDERVKEFAQEFQTVAIPETDDYANGWNDCRKRVREDLNRLVQLTQGNNHNDQ